MENKVVLLLHLDHGGSEHAYTLFLVAEDRLEEAKRRILDAWRSYEDNDRKNWWDELLDAAMKASGIPYEILSYDPLLIETGA